MVKWMFLLLVIFLVPRCHCNKFAVNKTGILFNQLDHLLAKNTEEHVTFYARKRECFRGLEILEENYRTEHYGIELLQNILKRYNYLTQLYNSGCKKQENGTFSKKDPICGPFGCHKVNIRFLRDQPFQDGDFMSQRSNVFNTNINRTNNNRNIWLATQSPIILPHSLLTPHSLTTPHPPKTPPKTPPQTTEPSRADHHCSEPFSEKDRKWLPLPFHPWGYCPKIHPVGAPPDKGV